MAASNPTTLYQLYLRSFTASLRCDPAPDISADGNNEDSLVAIAIGYRDARASNCTFNGEGPERVGIMVKADLLQLVSGLLTDKAESAPVTGERA